MRSSFNWSLKSSKYVLMFLLFLLFLLFSINNYPGYAENLPFSLDPPVQKKIITEKKYLFFVMQYAPVVNVQIFTNTQESIKTIQEPENTAIAYVSARSQGNYSWYFSLLSSKMQQDLITDLNNTGKTSDNLANEWKIKYQKVRIELTHRVERGDVSIIRYKVISTDNNLVIEYKDLAIGLTDSPKRWAVIDLKEDLIYKNWNFDGTINYLSEQ